MPSEGVEKKGPWEDEPNSLRFLDEDTGYTCFIRRHPQLGHLCGYVFVPDDLVDRANELLGKIEDIYVHGGITFSGFFKEPNVDPKTYAIGFDCAHAWDFAPSIYEHLYPFATDPMQAQYMNDMGVPYKDINFVKNECRKLAKQLHEILTGCEEKCQEK